MRWKKARQRSEGAVEGRGNGKRKGGERREKKDRVPLTKIVDPPLKTTIFQF